MTHHETDGPRESERSDESRRARTAARLRRHRDQAEAGFAALQRRRPTSPTVDTVFAVAERDRDIHGGTLAGALAFRFFLFLLPLTLLVVVVLGLTLSNDPGQSDQLADRFGMRGALADALVETAEQGRASRWWALGVGLVGTAWSALGAVRSIRLVHFLAWDRPPTPLRDHPRAIGAFVGANLLLLGAPLVAGWIHAIFGVFGSLAGLVGAFCVYIALWIVLSAGLPRREGPVRFLAPGAIVVAIGTYLLHLVVVYFFGPRIESSASVYGGVGVAAVMLTWLFLIARLIVLSAVVNAVVDERRRPALVDDCVDASS